MVQLVQGIELGKELEEERVCGLLSLDFGWYGFEDPWSWEKLRTRMNSTGRR